MGSMLGKPSTPAQRRQRLWGLLNALQSAAQWAQQSGHPSSFKAVTKLRQQIVDEYGGWPVPDEPKERPKNTITIAPGVTIRDDGSALAIEANLSIDEAQSAKALAHYLLAWGGFDK